MVPLNSRRWAWAGPPIWPTRNSSSLRAALGAEPRLVDHGDVVGDLGRVDLLDLEAVAQRAGDLVAQLHELGAAQREVRQAHRPGGADLVDDAAARRVPLGVGPLELHPDQAQALVPDVGPEGVQQRVVVALGGERAAELHGPAAGAAVDDDAVHARDGEDTVSAVEREEGTRVLARGVGSYRVENQTVCTGLGGDRGHSLTPFGSVFRQREYSTVTLPWKRAVGHSFTCVRTASAFRQPCCQCG